jgi:alginate O-acetyltransferase complex protein AlgI
LKERFREGLPSGGALHRKGSFDLPTAKKYQPTMKAILQQLLSFEFYYSVPFWLALAVIIVVIRLVSRTGTILRWVMLSTSLVMILALPRMTPAKLAFLVLFCCVVYASVRLIAAAMQRRRKRLGLWFAWTTVVLIVAVMAFFKYRYIQQVFADAVRGPGLRGTTALFISVIGFSYISFRMIHVVVESYKTSIQDVDLVSFLSYLLFFPAFISGPIHTYAQFRDQLQELPHASIKKDICAGIPRVVHGLFKKLVLAAVIYPYVLPQVLGKNSSTLGSILLSAYLYTIYLYLDFSGYSDLAIGSAKMIGVELPENFNNPFFKPNIQRLWASWHMSLTIWLTQYLYWPLVRKLRSVAFFMKRPVLLSSICIIVTFVVCGMWHGETANFIIWGLYQGAGIAVMNIYRGYKRRITNPRLQKYFVSPYSKVVGIVGTFNYFAFGLLILSMNSSGLKAMVFNLPR